MARIRSVKPEFWHDRKLARSCSRDARMLYVGLWNYADEHARLNGDPAVIKGEVFPYDDIDIVPLLLELAAIGRVQPYIHEGDPFLFLPKLPDHQRLDTAKVASKFPDPPAKFPDPATVFPDLHNGQARTAEPAGQAIRPDSAQIFPDESGNGAEKSTLLYVAGSMEHGGKDPTPPADNRTTAQTLIGEHIDACRHRPPKSVIGQLGKQISAMLAEGIDPDHVRGGLAAFRTKDLSPSLLPSLVNGVMNRPATRNGKLRVGNGVYDDNFDPAMQ